MEWNGYGIRVRADIASTPSRREVSERAAPPVRRRRARRPPRSWLAGRAGFRNVQGHPVRAFRRRVWHPAVEAARLAPLRVHDLRHGRRSVDCGRGVAEGDRGPGGAHVGDDRPRPVRAPVPRPRGPCRRRARRDGARRAPRHGRRRRAAPSPVPSPQTLPCAARRAVRAARSGSRCGADVARATDGLRVSRRCAGQSGGGRGFEPLTPSASRKVGPVR
jgi:hypothetical protein